MRHRARAVCFSETWYCMANPEARTQWNGAPGLQFIEPQCTAQYGLTVVRADLPLPEAELLRHAKRAGVVGVYIRDHLRQLQHSECMVE